LYLEGLPLFARGQVSIPDHAAALREMRLLQRRTARSGKDSVDHGAGGSDDHVNSIFGSLYLVTKVPRPDMLASQLIGGCKVFNTTHGTTLIDSVTPALHPPQPSPPSSLPSALADVRLDEAAQKRLAEFKADFLRERGSIAFYGKCFHG
jgi:hypothetical protein